MSAIDAIVLAADDTVATALRALPKGAEVRLKTPAGERVIAVTEDIPLCHKLALTAMPQGAPIRKYGAVIGEATAAIAPGALVHVHNLRSCRGRRSVAHI